MSETHWYCGFCDQAGYFTESGDEWKSSDDEASPWNQARREHDRIFGNPCFKQDPKRRIWIRSGGPVNREAVHLAGDVPA